MELLSSRFESGKNSFHKEEHKNIKNDTHRNSIIHKEMKEVCKKKNKKKRKKQKRNIFY